MNYNLCKDPTRYARSRSSASNTNGSETANNGHCCCCCCSNGNGGASGSQYQPQQAPTTGSFLNYYTYSLIKQICRGILEEYQQEADTSCCQRRCVNKNRRNYDADIEECCKKIYASKTSCLGGQQGNCQNRRRSCEHVSRKITQCNKKPRSKSTCSRKTKRDASCCLKIICIKKKKKCPTPKKPKKKPPPKKKPKIQKPLEIPTPSDSSSEESVRKPTIIKSKSILAVVPSVVVLPKPPKQINVADTPQTSLQVVTPPPKQINVADTPRTSLEVKTPPHKDVYVNTPPKKKPIDIKIPNGNVPKERSRPVKKPPPKPKKHPCKPQSPHLLRINMERKDCMRRYCISPCRFTYDCVCYDSLENCSCNYNRNCNYNYNCDC